MVDLLINTHQTDFRYYNTVNFMPAYATDLSDEQWLLIVPLTLDYERTTRHSR